MTSGIDILIVGTSEIETLAPDEIWSEAVDRVAFEIAPEDAISRLRDETFDLAALVCHRRGSFSIQDIAALQSADPLCRVVAITGPWCEGPWRRDVDVVSGLTIVPWHRWNRWLGVSARQLRGGATAAWSLPVTTAHDELADYWSRVRVPQSRGLIAIDSDSQDAAEAVGDILSLAGYAYVWQPSKADRLIYGASVIVVEGNGWDEEMSDRVRDVRAQHPQAQIVLLINFPLPADVMAAKAAGVTSVIGKPFTLGEFLGQLCEAAGDTEISTPSDAA